MATTNYWEEDFLGGERAEYKTGMGELIGEIRKVGSSWEVNRIRNGNVETIATQPNKRSAELCLSNFVAAEEG